MGSHSHKDELNNLDLKATPARKAVLDLLESIDKPVDIATIITYLQRRNIGADPATVFRIMNVFTTRGLTRQIELSEGKARYELAGPDHHHFICENCGVIEDISDCNISELEKDIQRKKGLLIKRHSLEFFGLCRNCQK